MRGPAGLAVGCLGLCLIAGGCGGPKGEARLVLPDAEAEAVPEVLVIEADAPPGKAGLPAPTGITLIQELSEDVREEHRSFAIAETQAIARAVAPDGRCCLEIRETRYARQWRCQPTGRGRVRIEVPFDLAALRRDIEAQLAEQGVEQCEVTVLVQVTLGNRELLETARDDFLWLDRLDTGTVLWQRWTHRAGLAPAELDVGERP